MLKATDEMVICITNVAASTVRQLVLMVTPPNRGQRAGGAAVRVGVEVMCTYDDFWAAAVTAPRCGPPLGAAEVGSPVTRLGVSFVPIYFPTNELPDIATGPDSGLAVEELTHASVPTLLACNPTDTPVLLAEGEHFVGGMQNRTLNITVVVPANSRLELPVACLEQGRWGHERAYRRCPSFSPRRVRAVNQEAVFSSMTESGSRSSDQAAVWHEVDSILNENRVASPTSAASDLRREERSWSESVEELERLGPLHRQCGIAVCHGGRVVAVDLFGAPNLLKAHWGPLVRSYLLDEPRSSGRPSSAEALRIIRRFGSAEAHEAPGLGLGIERRVRDRHLVGQSLSLDGMVVHASIFRRLTHGR